MIGNTANKKQLVDDLLMKAKQMEILINALPAAKEFDQKTSSTSPSSAEEGKKADNADDTDEELASLEKEMQDMNEEYLTVLSEAGK